MALPAKFRLYSYQHNGQYLFVSNDEEGDDLVVEAHPYPDEDRNWFEAERVNPDEDFWVRLYNPSTGRYLFVSNDMADGDNIVEAHPYRDESRNTFNPLAQGDGSFVFWHPDTETYLFLSNDQRGDDYVIEAHAADEARNRFVAKE